MNPFSPLLSVSLVVPAKKIEPILVGSTQQANLL